MLSDVNCFLLSGLLKEYLRELPEPVFSNCLYQMLVDAMGVFLPDDPDGNAKLVFSILDCLPKANRVSPICTFKFQDCSSVNFAELFGTHHGSSVESDGPVLT